VFEERGTTVSAIIALLVIVAVVVVGAGAYHIMTTGEEGVVEEPIGGPCSYDKFRGECRITSIQKTEESMQQENTIGGPGYEGFEVKFRFTPTEPLNLENVKLNLLADTVENFLDKEHLLLLTNSWYPGPEYLEKYNIEENAVFDCELWLITKGTCSPAIFKFDNIDTSDYFETKNN